MSAAIPSLPPVAKSRPPRPTSRWFESLWLALSDPRPLVVVAALLLTLLVVSSFVPQLPGQLRGEPLAADRWLTSAAENLGGAGALLRGAGLFDVMHNLAFRLLLWAGSFLLLVQIAHAMLFAVQFRRLSTALDKTEISGGDPLPVTLPLAVQRWRVAVDGIPVTVAARSEALVRTWATRLERRTLRVPPSPPQVELQTAPTDGGAILEERLLATRGLTGAALQPLLPTGMLLALALVWWYSVAAHQFIPAALLPGEHASDAALGIAFEYALVYPAPGMIGPVIKVNKDGQQQMLPMAPAQLRIDGVTISVQPGAPAMLVQTLDAAPLLAQPGQANTAATLAVGFPNPGSEQALVMPLAGIGMRIIRQDTAATDAVFVVEIFQGDGEEPVQRLTIDGSQVERILTPVGDIPLGFVPVPMFQVQAYTTPPVWWLLLALLLAVAGALGFRRQPAFLLAQAGPWPVNRSVVIVQTSHRTAGDEVQRELTVKAPSSVERDG